MKKKNNIKHNKKYIKMTKKPNTNFKDIECSDLKNNKFNSILSTYFSKLSQEKVYDIDALKKDIRNQIFNNIIEECIISYKQEILEMQKIINILNKEDNNGKIIEKINMIVKNLNQKIEMLTNLK